MKETVLCSIDSSSTKTGWAIFVNGKFKESGVIDLDNKECKKKYKNNSDIRIKDMCLEIIDLLNKYNPNIIVIEKLNVMRNANAVRTLSKIIGIVYGYSIVNDCYYYEIQPSQWRSKIGIQSSGRKRDEYKKLSKDYVKNKFGKDVSDDESDSICAGLGYIKMFS